MKKKVLAAILCVAMVGSMLMGCSGGDAGSDSGSGSSSSLY